MRRGPFRPSRPALHGRCSLLGAGKAGVGVLFASSFVASSMDVLAEEFGSLTPEQLAAPIPTVEVRAGRAGSGRGRDESSRGVAPRALATEGCGPRLLRMLSTPRMLRPPRGGGRAPFPSRPPRARGRPEFCRVVSCHAALGSDPFHWSRVSGEDWSSPTSGNILHLLRLREDREVQGA